MHNSNNTNVFCQCDQLKSRPLSIQVHPGTSNAARRQVRCTRTYMFTGLGAVHKWRHHRTAHCTWRAHIGKNISVIFQMTSMEAYWVLTETGARSGEDDFVSLLAPSCNQCYYASSQVGDLRGHLITHSGEKSNKCNQCNNASLQAGNLNKHLKGTVEKSQANAAKC